MALAWVVLEERPRAVSCFADWASDKACGALDKEKGMERGVGGGGKEDRGGGKGEGAEFWGPRFYNRLLLMAVRNPSGREVISLKEKRSLFFGLGAWQLFLDGWVKRSERLSCGWAREESPSPFEFVTTYRQACTLSCPACPFPTRKNAPDFK